MPVVQFSIPAAPWERLEKAVMQGESTNQTAKRLLTQLLLGDDSPAHSPDPDVLDELNRRLDRLEEIVQLGNPAGPDRLDKLEEHLEKLESGVKSLALQFSDRVYELSETQRVFSECLSEIQSRLDSVPAVDLSPLESRLSEIEGRLDSVPPAVVPTPARLPKATKGKTQETPNSGETP